MQRHETNQDSARRLPALGRRLKEQPDGCVHLHHEMKTAIRRLFISQRNNGASIQELASALGDTLEVTINTYSHMYDDTNRQVSLRVDKILESREGSGE